MFELSAAAGFVEPRLHAEFPGLRLDWVTIRARPRSSPPAVKARLRSLSDRYRGANVIAMRTQAIPHAYRAFFHQVGLDPEGTRVPIEEAAVARLLQGHFSSHGVVDDALLIALVETGVPIWGLDAEFVDAAGLGIRTSVEGDCLGSGEHMPEVSPGRLIVADAQCAHALLFGEIASTHRVASRTRWITLFAVGVDGVPAIHIEEALWVATEVLGSV